MLTADDPRARLKFPPAHDLDPRRVVAYFVHSEPDGAGVQSKIEYFEESQLRVFLNMRRVPDDGILQKFVDGPEERQRLLRVLWTPYICSVETSANKHALRDTKVPAQQRAATFDAPSHLSDVRSVRGSALTERLMTCAPPPASSPSPAAWWWRCSC